MAGMNLVEIPPQSVVVEHPGLVVSESCGAVPTAVPIPILTEVQLVRSDLLQFQSELIGVFKQVGLKVSVVYTR